MDIASVRSFGGLPATASRLRESQASFDAAAEAVTLAAQVESPADAQGLAEASAALLQERLVNQVLAGVFKAQDQQAKTLLDTIAP